MGAAAENTEVFPQVQASPNHPMQDPGQAIAAMAGLSALGEVAGGGERTEGAEEHRDKHISSLDWSGLHQAINTCTRCELHQSRTQGVPGVGDQQAEWLLIGEAPGAEEDRQGQPFVGQAGKLLDAMLAAIGQSRAKNVYIANVLKSRPPANRDPLPQEVAACAPYLVRQIELVNPRIILALGRFAAQSLLQTDTPIGRLRGQVHQYRGIPLVVTYHPAYLLRNPADKAKVWDDLLLARRVWRVKDEG